MIRKEQRIVNRQWSSIVNCQSSIVNDTLKFKTHLNNAESQNTKYPYSIDVLNQGLMSAPIPV